MPVVLDPLPLEAFVEAPPVEPAPVGLPLVEPLPDEPLLAELPFEEPVEGRCGLLFDVPLDPPLAPAFVPELPVALVDSLAGSDVVPVAALDADVGSVVVVAAALSVPVVVPALSLVAARGSPLAGSAEEDPPPQAARRPTAMAVSTNAPDRSRSDGPRRRDRSRADHGRADSPVVAAMVSNRRAGLDSIQALRMVYLRSRRLGRPGCLVDTVWLGPEHFSRELRHKQYSHQPSLGDRGPSVEFHSRCGPFSPLRRRSGGRRPAGFAAAPGAVAFYGMIQVTRRRMSDDRQHRNDGENAPDWDGTGPTR